MTNTVTIPVVTEKIELEDTLDHYYCSHNPNIALCGSDISDASDEYFDCASCVVCEDLGELYDLGICPRTGKECDCNEE